MVQLAGAVVGLLEKVATGGSVMLQTAGLKCVSLVDGRLRSAPCRLLLMLVSMPHRIVNSLVSLYLILI